MRVFFLETPLLKKRMKYLTKVWWKKIQKNLINNSCLLGSLDIDDVNFLLCHSSIFLDKTVLASRNSFFYKKNWKQSVLSITLLKFKRLKKNHVLNLTFDG